MGHGLFKRTLEAHLPVGVGTCPLKSIVRWQGLLLHGVPELHMQSAGNAGQEFVDWPVSKDSAMVQEGHSGTESLGAVEIMGRHEDRATCRGFIPHQSFYNSSGFRIKGFHGLVENHDRGVAGDGLRQQQFALHAVAQVAHTPIHWDLELVKQGESAREIR